MADEQKLKRKFILDETELKKNELSKLTEKAVISSQAAFLERDELVLEAQGIEAIPSDQLFERAVDICKRLQEAMDFAEEHRTSAKAPYLTVGKVIDAVAKKYGNPLLAEFERVMKLISKYHEKQLAENAAEQDRIRFEYRELQGKKDKATDDYKLKVAELQTKIETAEKDLTNEDPAKRMDAETKVIELKTELEMAKQEFDLQIASLSTAMGSLASTAVAVPSEDLVKSKSERDYVAPTPQELLVLAVKHPELVKIEIRRKETLALIRERVNPDDPMSPYKVKEVEGLILFDSLNVKLA